MLAVEHNGVMVTRRDDYHFAFVYKLAFRINKPSYNIVLKIKQSSGNLLCCCSVSLVDFP